MPTTSDAANEWIAGEIFDILSGLGHRVFMYDQTGERVFDPPKSNRLFSTDAKMMVTLGWTKGKPARPLVTVHTSDATDAKTVEAIRAPLRKHNLYDHSFDIRPYGRNLEPKMFAHMNKTEVTESAWTGSTRTSRWCIGETQVVIRHNQKLMDSDHTRRWTRIRDIFIHGQDGTRYKCPWKHILGARALAQHMNQQGQPWDTAGQAVHTLITALLQMRKLKNWCMQHRPDVIDQVSQLQQQIKQLLKNVSQDHTYPTAIDQAQQLSQAWAVDPQQPSGSWPSDMPQAVAGMVAALPGSDQPQPGEFREGAELDRWFDQFLMENIFGEDHTADVAAAMADSGSDDPRDVLSSLTKNVVGWSSRFEQDPRSVLDSLRAAMEKIKNIS
jgi:hypothetical protein